MGLPLFVPLANAFRSRPVVRGDDAGVYKSKMPAYTASPLFVVPLRAATLREPEAVWEIYWRFDRLLRHYRITSQVEVRRRKDLMRSLEGVPGTPRMCDAKISTDYYSGARKGVLLLHVQYGTSCDS